MNNKDKVQALECLREQLRQTYAKYDPDKVEIGDFTYGDPLVLSWGEENARLKIGKFCSIGANVQIYLGGNHHTDWMTTYPFNVLLKDQYPGIDGEVAATKGDVIIGNDVWIANNVVILSGVTIGDGAVIANSAVVTRDVLPYQVVVGNPGTSRTMVKRYRIQPAEAVKIWKLSWWDWPLEKIAAAIPMLTADDVDALVKFDKEWADE